MNLSVIVIITDDSGNEVNCILILSDSISSYASPNHSKVTRYTISIGKNICTGGNSSCWIKKYMEKWSEKFQKNFVFFKKLFWRLLLVITLNRILYQMPGRLRILRTILRVLNSALFWIEIFDVVSGICWNHFSSLGVVVTSI